MGYTLIGHRGGGQTRFNPELIAENTIESFTYAFKNGADYAETDIHLTADGKVIIYHDWHYENQHISKLTFSELNKCINNFLLLEEVLNEFSSKKFIFEIKAEDDIDQLLEVLVKNFPQLFSQTDKYRFISFDSGILSKIKNINPNIYTSWIVTKSNGRKRHYFFSKNDLKLAIDLKLNEVSGHFISFTRKQANSLRKNNIKIGIGPINTDYSMRFVSRLKPDLVYTDRLDKFKHLNS